MLWIEIEESLQGRCGSGDQISDSSTANSSYGQQIKEYGLEGRREGEDSV